MSGECVQRTVSFLTFTKVAELAGWYRLNQKTEHPRHSFAVNGDFMDDVGLVEEDLAFFVFVVDFASSSSSRPPAWSPPTAVLELKEVD